MSRRHSFVDSRIVPGRCARCDRPAPEHAPRISWFAWAWSSTGARERIPASSKLAGSWGWDAECSCGWSSSTGGATRRSVRRAVAEHKLAGHAVVSPDLWR